MCVSLQSSPHHGELLQLLQSLREEKDYRNVKYEPEALMLNLQFKFLNLQLALFSKQMMLFLHNLILVEIAADPYFCHFS